MSDAVGSKQSTTAWESPPVKPLDEAVWQAWKAKGRKREKQAGERRMRALSWVVIAALLVFAGLWFRLAPYEVVIRFVVAAAAAGMTLEAFRKRQYGFGVLFACLVIIYNPIAPLFSVSDNWQRGLVVATVVPFLASIAARDLKGAPLG